MFFRSSNKNRQTFRHVDTKGEANKRQKVNSKSVLCFYGMVVPQKKRPHVASQGFLFLDKDKVVSQSVQFTFKVSFKNFDVDVKAPMQHT